MANTKIPVELSSTPGIVDNSNATAITIDSSENVGIGDSSPAAKLDVTSTSSDAVFLRSSNATTSNVYITNTNATTGNTANLYFAPANNVAGSQISSIAIEDFSSSANRTADLAFSTRLNGTMSERMRIDSSGNVGIGTSSPSNLLTVGTGSSGIAAGTNSTPLKINNKGNWDTNSYEAIDLEVAELRTVYEGSNGWSWTVNTGNSSSVAEALRVSSSGNVGIGTTSPNASADLHIADTSDTRIWVEATSGDTAELYAGTGVSLFNRSNSFLNFGTNNTERMRIDSSGNLLVGASDQAWGTSSGFRVNSAGQAGQFVTITNTSSTATDEALIVHRQAAVTNGEAIQFYRAGASVGSITLSSGSTSYNTSSDYRLKTNIQDMQDNGVERVKKLRPVTFNWIEDDNGTHEGFIAHEIQEAGWNDGVVGVKDDEERKQSVDYGRITPLLVKAIQEQQTQIDALQSEINELKNS